MAASFLQGHGAKILGIGLRHIGKTQAKAVVIGTDQRIAALQVDMIFQDNQAALLELQIDSACRIGKQHCLDSQTSKHAHRKSHAQQRMSFVIVDASLHGRHRDLVYFSHYEITGMSFSAGGGEMGNG